MKVFLDFEASSLSERSYPVEVGWVFEDGRTETHLIAPAPEWDDWDPASEAIHGIARTTLLAEGMPHAEVASRMVEVLSGHDLLASAPSWDGKWLSALLRSAGLPRHALRLRDTDEAIRETVTEVLAAVLKVPRLPREVHNLVARAGSGNEGPPAHRALADALAERERWVRAHQAARELAARLRPA